MSGEPLSFEGRVAVCLPAALNTKTATDEQRVALETMESRVFDQRVYGYCSGAVAGFVRLAVKAHMLAHANIKGAACVMPLSCTCGTAGTQLDSDACHSTCPDVPCNEKNCGSVLRKNMTLNVAACTCSRSTTCSETEPAEKGPALCRDWLTSLE